MSYIAVAATEKHIGRATRTIIEVTTNEAASLEAMRSYVKQGCKVIRLLTTEDIYFAYSEGKNLALVFDELSENNKKRKLIVV